MVAARDNWSDVIGVVREVGDPASGIAPLVVDVERVEAVEGWPNLLGSLDGPTTLRAPAGVLDSIEPGARMTMRARLAGPGVAFLSPDPADHRQLT